MQMVLMTDLNTDQLGTSVKVSGGACPRTAAVIDAPEPGASWSTPLLFKLQVMLDRSRAASGTNISGIITSGALDRLAAALQVVLLVQNCCSVRLAPQTSHVAARDTRCWCLWLRWL